MYKNRPDYDHISPSWQYIKDVFDGIASWSLISNNSLLPTERAKLFLTQFLGESNESYIKRFSRSVFEDSFNIAINDFLNLAFISGSDLTTDSEEFKTLWDDIGRMTESGDIVLRQLFFQGLLYGLSYLFVEYFDDGTIYWTPIEPLDVVDWVLSPTGQYLSVTIKRNYYDSNSKKYLKVYRQYKDGSWYDFYYEKGKEIVKDSGTYTPYNHTVPFFRLRFSVTAGYLGRIFFRSLADLAVSYYNVSSDYHSKMSLCSTPILVRYSGSDSDINLKPGVVINLNAPEHFVKYVEPSAQSLEQSRLELQGISDRIRFRGLDFIKTPESRVSSNATTLSILPLEGTLLGYLINFLDSLYSPIDYTNILIGNNLPVRISIAPKLTNPLDDSQSVFALLALYEKDAIGRQTFLRKLESKDYIQDSDYQYEISRPLNKSINES